MNRKKKINNTLKAKLKKANAKLQKSNKPRYVSKAERAKLESLLQTNITTPRLSIRPLVSADEQLVYALFNQQDVKTFIGDRGINSLGDATAYIEQKQQKDQAELGFSLYCCHELDSDKSIGICGLLQREGMENIEIGFALLSEYQQKGLIKEASEAVLTFAQNTLKLKTIDAITHPENIASIALLNSLSFTFVEDTTLPKSDEQVKLFRWQC